MKKIVFTYGTIAGFIIIVTNMINMETGHSQMWLGFLVMFIAFSCIYVAIRQYRDKTLGGVISFVSAFLMGLGISAIASVVYVAVWETYLVVTDYGFLEAYANAMVEAKKHSGANEAELVQAVSEADKFRIQYMNPFFRLPITFLEIFPVGFLVSLASAAVLRNHKSAG